MSRISTLLNLLGAHLLSVAVFLTSSCPNAGFAGVLEATGVNLLRRSEPTLTGTGISVTQPEAISTLLGVDWEINPAAVGQPGTLFTWSSDLGSSTEYPNLIGLESSHANAVGGLFYGAQGVAPAVDHVYAYEAEHFYGTYILSNAPLPARIVNQSFIFTADSQAGVNQNYDDYAARHQTLFVSGVGNTGSVAPSGTAYNGLGVGAFGGASAVGPTTDNGRCKPDLVAPATFTSFSAPVVAGASALLLQAALREDGGAGTAALASDTRVLRALLLNGCVKPDGWSHSINVPLDYRYGAGVLNIYNSYLQLRGGKHSASETTAAALGTVFQVGTASNAVPSLAGWDLSQLLSTAVQDQANHYLFQLETEVPRTLVASVVWDKQAGETNINDLDLVLLRRGDSALIARSASGVDNVEHLFVTDLLAGSYDLQVIKRGGRGRVSNSEKYALAFEFFKLPLRIGSEGTNLVLSWPLAPAGFRVAMSSNVNSGAWIPCPWPVLVTNENRIYLPPDGAGGFYRLGGP